MGFLDKLTGLVKSDDSFQTNYLSLWITPHEVHTLIWMFDGEKVKNLGIGREKFDAVDGLIHATAAAIDKAGEQARSDVEKTVFGLSYFWLEGGKPKEETNKILKDLTRELDLSPQAFISQAAAINHLLKVEESQTPAAILVGAFSNFCEAHILSNNNIVKSVQVREKANAAKVAALIANLKGQDHDLPSRIVVFGEESDDLEKSLKKHDFGDIFLHEPKVQKLESEDCTKAVAYAQAADVLGHEPSLVVAGPIPQQVPDKEDKGQENELGFVEGEDILKSQEAPPEKVEIETSKEDYAVESSQQTPEEMVIEEPKQKKPFAFPKIPAIALLDILKFEKSPKKILIILGILLFLAVVGSFVASKTITSAEVIIKVNAKDQENSFKADVDPRADEVGSKVPGEEVTETADGSQKAVTTGSKKLGDKSKGTVKVLNWDKQAKTFKASTEVITKDGLKFTLDNEVQVASRSATAPSEAKTGATSFDFGPKYNINAGVDMTIVGFDEIFYSAVSDTAFTGGAERQATVASQDDLDKLEKSLTETLTEKAKDTLTEKASGKKIQKEAIATKVTKKTFDKKVDDESSIVNLDMAIEASAIAYDENQLKEFIVQNSINDLPENYEARSENIELVDVTIRRVKDILQLSGRFKASLVPKIDEEALKDQIKGKGAKSAREIIKNSIPEFADVTVKFKPSFGLFEMLPTNKSKIKITLEAS